MKKICGLLLAITTLSFIGCGPKGTEPKNGADVESAKVVGYAVLSTTVDQAAKVITYTVPSYAKEFDFKSLTADFVVSEGASWAPKMGEVIDWTLPEFVIVVTSESRNTKNEYTVVRAYNSSIPDKSGKVVNTYTGDIEVTITGAGEPVKVSGQKIILKRMFSNVIAMQLKDFKFGSISVGDVMVDSIGLFDAGKADMYALAGQDSTTVNIGVETAVLAKVFGKYNSASSLLELDIAIGGVPGMSISVKFAGSVFNDPTATEPIFVGVVGSNVLGVQDFKNGNLVYYADSKFENAAFADVVQTIKLPQGATIKWYNDKPFDPTQPIQYFNVTSSDGSADKRYNITRKTVEFNNLTKYSFEDWELTEQDEPMIDMYTPLPAALQVPNTAVSLLKAFGMYAPEGAYPASPETVGKVGKAAHLETLDTKGGEMWEDGPSAPKVTAGSMFVGGFDMMAAMADPMMSTLFGLPYNGKKVVSVKGWYKYASGAQMYNNMTPITGVDKPIISCVVYDISDNYSATLTGHDTYTSSRIVGVGKIHPSAAANYTEFKVDLKYNKPYTPSNNKVYKLAIITSASADGDKFIGAPGSVLIVDEIELVTE